MNQTDLQTYKFRYRSGAVMMVALSRKFYHRAFLPLVKKQPYFSAYRMPQLISPPHL
jgi:hypothetical protein